MNSPLTHTTFLNLKINFLKMLDNFNANDLTGTNSSGEVAGIAINKALHKIYDMIRESRYVQALPSTSFSSTIDQDYIDLDIEPQLDEIDAITDTLNNLRLVRRNWDWYRRHIPNPENVTGIPSVYARRFSRIYLSPRPASVINYTVDFVKNTKDLVNDGDISLLPTKYDYFINAEARVEWYMMEDSNNVPPSVIEERNDMREIALGALLSNFDTFSQSERHFGGHKIAY